MTRREVPEVVAAVKVLQCVGKGPRAISSAEKLQYAVKSIRSEQIDSQTLGKATKTSETDETPDESGDTKSSN